MSYTTRPGPGLVQIKRSGRSWDLTFEGYTESSNWGAMLHVGETQARQPTTIITRPLLSARVAALGATIARRVVTLLAVVWLASGCTHNVLYDENRDKQGQQAKKAAAEARIVDAVASLEKFFSELAALEETRARDRVTYFFDLELRTVSRSRSLTSRFLESSEDVDGLQTVVEARLGKLGLSEVNLEQLKMLRSLAPQLSARQVALETTLADFRGTVGYHLADCTDIYAASGDPSLKSDRVSDEFLAAKAANRRELARLKFQELIADCKKIDDVIAKWDKSFAAPGIVKTLHKRLDEIEQEIFGYQMAMQKAREALNVATAQFSRVEAATKTGAKSNLGTLEMRAGRLRDSLISIGEGSAAFGGAGAHVIAEERLKHLQIVLGAVAGRSPEGGGKLTPDEQVSVAIVRDLTALTDEANKLFADAGKPRRVPFLAAIDQQKLVIEGFEASQNAKRKQASAVRKELEAALNEASALVRVLEPLARNKAWATRSISDLHVNLAGTEKIEFIRTLAIYADEVQRLRIETAVWGARGTAAQCEEALFRSKFAAAQWDGLTDTIATVLSDYHAAGIKKADLAEFFKALGLVAIGVGVAL